MKIATYSVSRMCSAWYEKIGYFKLLVWMILMGSGAYLPQAAIFSVWYARHDLLASPKGPKRQKKTGSVRVTERIQSGKRRSGLRAHSQ